jgi:outer membrane protein OmpA-like peptidoglycan-associated protein
MFGPRDFIGGGGLGGFEASYFPLGGPGVLLIAQRIAAEYKNTLEMSGGVVSAHPDLPVTPQMTALVTRANAIPDPADRAAFVSLFTWDPSETQGTNAWHEQLRTVIENAWGGQHEFFLNIPLWQWIGASVMVMLDIAARSRNATDHMSLETYKTPSDQSLRTYGISHQVAHNAGDNARDQAMRLASTSIGPKEYDLLKEEVLFAHDSAALDDTAERTLRQFISTFDGSLGHQAHQEITVVLSAHTSASGSAEYNLGLARRRAGQVESFLRDNGFHNIDTRVSEDIQGEAQADQSDPNRAHDRRVDLVVDGGERMVTAVHEFGHAFGLDDEYGTVGTTPAHDDMSRAMTDASGAHLPGAVREHNAGIMSYGNEIRPRHYATFHNALETVTDKNPWSLGTPRPKTDVAAECTLTPGDFNVPGGDVRTA